MNRQIVHIDMDAFFVSVERSRDPALRGKPVVVGPSKGNRGVVAAASYEARPFGVHSGQPAATARRLCPEAVFVQGSYRTYTLVSQAIAAIFRSWTPLVEMRSIDEACLDLTGFERVYGPVSGTVELIISQVREQLGLDLSAGIASNKLVAKIAAGCAKPSGMLRVMPGCERQFLAPLKLSRVPGVGDALAERLEKLSIRTVGELQELDCNLLVRVFGKASGSWLYRMASGKGSEQVHTEREVPKSVGNSITFREDSLDRDFLDGMLYHLCEKVGSRVRAIGLVGGTITLKLRYADFKTISRATSAPMPGTDSDMNIFEHARNLMQPLLERKIRVRLLGVTLSKLHHSVSQLDIFCAENQKKLIEFYKGLDLLRDKYGYEVIQKGRTYGLDGLRHRRRKKIVDSFHGT